MQTDNGYSKGKMFSKVGDRNPEGEKQMGGGNQPKQRTNKKAIRKPDL